MTIKFAVIDVEQGMILMFALHFMV